MYAIEIIYMTAKQSAAVVGAGAFGTALARMLALKGIRTTLWALEPEVVESIRSQAENTRYLPGVSLPESLSVTGTLVEAITGADVVISAVPTQYVRAVFGDAGSHLRAAGALVSVSKGIEVTTLQTPTQILTEIAGGGDPVAVSGPSFAAEVAAGHPTAVVAASRDPRQAALVRDLLATPNFRAYSATDVISVELGGALKNVIAIAAGITAGLEFGRNTVAALITRGLAEMTRLGVALGGDPLTFAGLSGLGDLVLTCTGALSRNRTVGIEIGQGRSLTEILADTSTVAEGVKTTIGARLLADRHDVEMPITEQVYLTLYEEKDPRSAVLDLMSRSLRDEQDTGA